MGYQKMNEYEIDQTVERLAQLPQKQERVYEQPRCAKMDKEGVEAMVIFSKIWLLLKLRFMKSYLFLYHCGDLDTESKKPVGIHLDQK